MTKQQPASAGRSQEPTWWDDFVMWWLIGPVGGIAIAIVLLLMVGCVLDDMDEERRSFTLPSVLPADFNHEFYDWCMKNLGPDEYFCYNHSVG